MTLKSVNFRRGFQHLYIVVGASWIMAVLTIAFTERPQPDLSSSAEGWYDVPNPADADGLAAQYGFHPAPGPKTKGKYSEKDVATDKFGGIPVPPSTLTDADMARLKAAGQAKVVPPGYAVTGADFGAAESQTLNYWRNWTMIALIPPAAGYVLIFVAGENMNYDGKNIRHAPPRSARFADRKGEL